MVNSKTRIIRFFPFDRLPCGAFTGCMSKASGKNPLGYEANGGLARKKGKSLAFGGQFAAFPGHSSMPLERGSIAPPAFDADDAQGKLAERTNATSASVQG